MRFLVDAHLPLRLTYLLVRFGHEATHTSQLPRGNRTSDAEINAVSEAEQRIVVTKDAGFVNSFLLSNRPYKLLLVTTGNISNSDLLGIFERNLPLLEEAFQESGYVELDRDYMTIHR